MRLHNIKPKHKLKKSYRIARGGKRGGYSGRGIKGQKSRAGAKIRPAIRDLMMKFPKTRGRAKHSFKSLFKKPLVFNLEIIEKNFKDGEIVNSETLFKKNMINKKNGDFPEIKILGRGEVSKKFVFQNILMSRQARDKIKKIGGIIK